MLYETLSTKPKTVAAIRSQVLWAGGRELRRPGTERTWTVRVPLSSDGGSGVAKTLPSQPGLPQSQLSALHRSWRLNVTSSAELLSRSRETGGKPQGRNPGGVARAQVFGLPHSCNSAKQREPAQATWFWRVWGLVCPVPTRYCPDSALCKDLNNLKRGLWIK